jgi:hypothetical protein
LHSPASRLEREFVTGDDLPRIVAHRCITEASIGKRIVQTIEEPHSSGHRSKHRATDCFLPQLPFVSMAAVSCRQPLSSCPFNRACSGWAAVACDASGGDPGTFPGQQPVALCGSNAARGCTSAIAFDRGVAGNQLRSGQCLVAVHSGFVHVEHAAVSLWGKFLLTLFMNECSGWLECRVSVLNVTVLTRQQLWQ